MARPRPILLNTYLTRILAAAVAALALAAPAPAAQKPLTAQLASALAVPHVDHSRSGAVAVDLATGRVLFARNPGLSLAPASTEKLALSYALLVTLGPVYRIPTGVSGDGLQDGAAWQGDLYLKGAGDPTLTSRGLAQLAAQLRAQGIRRVTGAVVGDETLFDRRRTAPGWKASYYLEESPPLSALVVDRARYRGRVSPNPALAAASTFRQVLGAGGIEVERPSRVGRAPEGAPELAAVQSPALLQILRAVNRESDNFTAELLLKHLGAMVGEGGTTLAGAAVVEEVLAAAGVPLEGVRVVDGSGLSLLDRLTTDSLAGILVAAWSDPLLRGSFLASLAVAGLNGTLEDRLERPPARGNVFAKTGTTSTASALAGYVAGRYAFAVVQNGSPVSYWWSRRAQDRFVTVLAARAAPPR